MEGAGIGAGGGGGEGEGKCLGPRWLGRSGSSCGGSVLGMCACADSNSGPRGGGWGGSDVRRGICGCRARASVRLCFCQCAPVRPCLVAAACPVCLAVCLVCLVCVMQCVSCLSASVPCVCVCVGDLRLCLVAASYPCLWVFVGVRVGACVCALDLCGCVGVRVRLACAWGRLRPRRNGGHPPPPRPPAKPSHSRTRNPLVGKRRGAGMRQAAGGHPSHGPPPRMLAPRVYAAPCFHPRPPLVSPDSPCSLSSTHATDACTRVCPLPRTLPRGSVCLREVAGEVAPLSLSLPPSPSFPPFAPCFLGAPPPQPLAALATGDAGVPEGDLVSRGCRPVREQVNRDLIKQRRNARLFQKETPAARGLLFLVPSLAPPPLPTPPRAPPLFRLSWLWPCLQLPPSSSRLRCIVCEWGVRRESVWERWGVGRGGLVEGGAPRGRGCGGGGRERG